MPGSAREVGNAIEEGVEFVWLTSPKSFIGNTHVKAVEVNKMKLGDPDSSGRRRPEIEQGSEYKISADLVIKSLGFDPENLPKLFGCDKLQVTRWGTIKTDFDTMETNIPGVFAAGDIIRGASLVVWGIKDGRDAAISIKNFIENIEFKKKVKLACIFSLSNLHFFFKFNILYKIFN
jgi:glutamate synthase (NADPH/NADH) small chain